MSRARTAGMTLIEVMIVVVIIAVAASALSLGMGALDRTQLRSACNKLMAATRFAYNRAIIQGTTTRIAFRLPADKFSLEEAHGRITLSRGEGDRRFGRTDDEVPQEAAVDPWAAAQARVEDTFKPNLGVSPFGPLTNQAGGTMKRYQDVPLGDGVRIVKLIVPHEPEPLERGDAALYFFPGGRTEHAVVHLADRYDNVFSLEIHPLTGKGKVHAELYEPDYLLDDTDHEGETEVDDR